MSLLSRLFGAGPQTGGAEPPQRDPEAYNGYAIQPEPISEGSQWRVAARIEKEVGGEVKTHHMIRADLLGDADMAVEESLRKAKRLIDEQGDTIFGRAG